MATACGLRMYVDLDSSSDGSHAVRRSTTLLEISVPIRQIRWQNFRAFRDTGWLTLRPITVLIGPNNSGKSSAIAPLLILKQTLESGRAQSPLVIRGELADAGSFADLIHTHDPNGKMTLSLRFHPPVNDGQDMPDLGVDPPAGCDLTFQAAKAAGIINLTQFVVVDGFNRPMLVRKKRTSGGGGYSLDVINQWADSDDDPALKDSVSEGAARQAIRRAKPDHFLFSGTEVLAAAMRSLIEPANRQSGDSPETQPSFRGLGEIEFSSFVSRYLLVVSYTEQHVTGMLNNLVYLGPLRDDPKRLYDISGDAPADVGVRGEFSPEILLRNVKQPLFKQVSRWMQRFGMPGVLTCRKATETAFSLVLEQDGKDTNFADIGFGFSQLLPLVVQGLTAEKDTLLITEQPEIHLNPALQTQLAGFFVEMTKRGVSILAETHSEHLILSLRTLIAQGAIQAEDVAIYFVERTGETSTIKDVPLKPNGHIEQSDWPSGFFEDSLKESFALASAQMRRRDAE